MKKDPRIYQGHAQYPTRYIRRSTQFAAAKHTHPVTAYCRTSPAALQVTGRLTLQSECRMCVDEQLTQGDAKLEQNINRKTKWCSSWCKNCLTPPRDQHPGKQIATDNNRFISSRTLEAFVDRALFESTQALGEASERYW